ncbi:MAG TPA: serine/threonine-protein kinase [Polyangiaceae bacterium]|nr:serine/threonine-protein kinase [Polyangiaceae bacterium]
MSSLRFGSLDRYEPLCPIGRGGMAEVYLAAWEVAPHVYRPVVIKRLLPHLSGDPAVAQMFLDEARLSCRLDHPRIVRTLQAGSIGGHCCIVMEYLDGQPLHRFLKRAYEYDALPIAMAVHIAIAMLDALAYAHELRDYQGNSLDVVHRDVSPHNVFVTRSGQIKVLDFGIAKARGQEGYTATGLIKGKVGYIAPEQALGAEVDRRADLFAVGVVLWEALTGMRLFKGGNEIATLNLNLHAPIPTPSSMRADVPAQLDDILVRALARDPRARFQAAEEMKAELEGWASEAGALVEDDQIARWMEELFAFELREDQQRVLDAMRRHESVPPSAAHVGVSRSSAPPSLSSRRGFWQRVSSRWTALGLERGLGRLVPNRFRNSESGQAWYSRIKLLALGVGFLGLGVMGR